MCVNGSGSGDAQLCRPPTNALLRKTCPFGTRLYSPWLQYVIVGAGSGPGGVEGERGVDGDLKDLFEKYGFSVDVCARVCEELGADVVSDLKVLEKEDVQALTWLKPIQQRKLLSLISDTQV